MGSVDSTMQFEFNLGQETEYECHNMPLIQLTEAMPRVTPASGRRDTLECPDEDDLLTPVSASCSAWPGNPTPTR